MARTPPYVFCYSFNPRSHEGSDAQKRASMKYMAVSIHAPTKGATQRSVVSVLREKFQSTLPRRERPCASDGVCKIVVVSIHAPTKGATDQVIHSVAAVLVSIHAPTKGATMPAKRYRPDKDGFNPRSHEGSDAGNIRAGTGRGGFNPRSHEGSDKNAMEEIVTLDVSIHAPTKGATDGRKHYIPLRSFQSTLPRRERHQRAIFDMYRVRFNPRSHEGSDLGCKNQKAVKLLFQSTLPRRERQL